MPMTLSLIHIEMCIRDSGNLDIRADVYFAYSLADRLLHLFHRRARASVKHDRTVYSLPNITQDVYKRQG